jgi:hypothetical protein
MTYTSMPLKHMQVLQGSGAEAVLTLGLPIDVDSCGCAVAHFLGLPLITVEGNPMVFTPINTPQVRAGHVVQMRPCVHTAAGGWETHLDCSCVLGLCGG